MRQWLSHLPSNPLPALLDDGHPGIAIHVHREFSNQASGPPNEPRTLPRVERLQRRPSPGGTKGTSWQWDDSDYKVPWKWVRMMNPFGNMLEY